MMKKTTFNLVLRALIGVAASLVIVGAMGLINESNSNKTIIEQAAGLKADATVMTVGGEAVSAEEYLYMVAYQAQSLSYYGITDLNTDLGDGMRPLRPSLRWWPPPCCAAGPRSWAWN